MDRKKRDLRSSRNVKIFIICESYKILLHYFPSSSWAKSVIPQATECCWSLFSCASINFGSNHRFFLTFHIACHSQINKNSENDSYNNNNQSNTVQLTWQRVNVNFSFFAWSKHTSLYNKCLTQYVVKRKSQCFHSSSFVGFHPTNGEWQK